MYKSPMPNPNQIESSLFGTCEVVEIVKGKFPVKGKTHKTREITIALPLNPVKGDGYWVTWGRDTYWVTGNLGMDKTIEYARQRAQEYLMNGYGDESK